MSTIVCVQNHGQCELVNPTGRQGVSWWILQDGRMWVGESSQTAECELVSPPKLQSVNWWVPPNFRVWSGQSYKMADCRFTPTRGFPANEGQKPRWRWKRQGALFVPLHWNCCVLSWPTPFFFMTCLTFMEQMKEYINSHSLLWCNEHQTEHIRHVCYVNVAVSCLRMLKVSLQTVRYLLPVLLTFFSLSLPTVRYDQITLYHHYQINSYLHTVCQITVALTLSDSLVYAYSMSDNRWPDPVYYQIHWCMHTVCQITVDLTTPYSLSFGYTLSHNCGTR